MPEETDLESKMKRLREPPWILTVMFSIGALCVSVAALMKPAAHKGPEPCRDEAFGVSNIGKDQCSHPDHIMKLTDYRAQCMCPRSPQATSTPEGAKEK